MKKGAVLGSGSLAQEDSVIPIGECDFVYDVWMYFDFVVVEEDYHHTRSIFFLRKLKVYFFSLFFSLSSLFFPQVLSGWDPRTARQ